MIRCSGCKNYFAPGRSICPVCGAGLPAIPPLPESALKQRPAELKDVKRSVLLLFILFCIQLLSIVLIVIFAQPEPQRQAAQPMIASSGGRAFSTAEASPNQAGIILIGLTWLALLAAAMFKWLPRWVLMIGLLGPGVAGPIYLAVCHREIRKLPIPWQIFGWIGGLGLGAITLIFLITGFFGANR